MQAGSDALRGGIDLGGTKIQAAIVSPAGEVSGEARRQTPTKGGPADVAHEMAQALIEAADAAGVQTDSLAGVGVGSPGNSNEETGDVSEAGNLPGWDGSFPLGPTLSEALGAPVRVANDVDVATNAEFKLGAGQPYDSILGVFWGTGVGGGLILDGKRWTGRGAAGEIGHMVVERGGARCPCGRRGCMEAYAGRGAMEAKARQEHDNGVKTDLFKIMKKRGKDRLSSSVWDHALRAERRPRRGADRPGPQGARRRGRIGRQPARPRRGDHRRRPRGPVRRAVRREDPPPDAPAPVRLRRPAADPPRPTRRPRRGDRRRRCCSTTSLSQAATACASRRGR